MSVKKYRIATIVKVLGGYAWFARMGSGVTKFGRDTGHETSLLGPSKADEQIQAQLIDDLVTQRVDAICVVPIFPQAIELNLSKARNKGIAVISHEASNQRNVDYDLEAFDNAAYGARLMDCLAQYLGEEGEYGILVGTLTGKSHNEWAQAAIARQMAKYPRMKMASKKLEDHDNQQIAYEHVSALLKASPKLKGIGCAMASVPGAAQAVEKAGRGGKVQVIGTSLPSVVKPYLLSGTVKQISLWDPADAGYVMNKLAVLLLEGQKVTDGMNLGVAGYNAIKLDGKVIYGAAWVDVTKDKLARYNF